jgi:hypothetical protein
VDIDGRKAQYAPKNVLALLDSIKSEYGIGPSESKFRVVNWSGEVIFPGTEEAELVLKLLEVASR